MQPQPSIPNPRHNHHFNVATDPVRARDIAEAPVDPNAYEKALEHLRKRTRLHHLVDVKSGRKVPGGGYERCVEHVRR